MTTHNYDGYGYAYETWSRVSRILATMTPQECMEAWAGLRSQFMTPQIEFFDISPDSEYLEWIGEDASLPGFYSRLSANGFMDCTEWSGPFTSPEEAMADLIEKYTD